MLSTSKPTLLALISAGISLPASFFFLAFLRKFCYFTSFWKLTNPSILIFHQFAVILIILFFISALFQEWWRERRRQGVEGVANAVFWSIDDNYQWLVFTYRNRRTPSNRAIYPIMDLWTSWWQIRAVTIRFPWKYSPTPGDGLTVSPWNIQRIVNLCRCTRPWWFWSKRCVCRRGCGPLVWNATKPIFQKVFAIDFQVRLADNAFFVWNSTIWTRSYMC